MNQLKYPDLGTESSIGYYVRVNQNITSFGSTWDKPKYPVRFVGYYVAWVWNQASHDMIQYLNTDFFLNTGRRIYVSY